MPLISLVIRSKRERVNGVQEQFSFKLTNDSSSGCDIRADKTSEPRSGLISFHCSMSLMQTAVMYQKCGPSMTERI